MFISKYNSRYQKHINKYCKYYYKYKRHILRRFFKFLFKNIICIFILCILFGIIYDIAYSKYYPVYYTLKTSADKKYNSIDDMMFQNVEPTSVLDKYNNVIQTIYTTHYKFVPITDISDYVLDGYVAVEDKNFYTHKGYDIVSIIRAGIELIKHKGVITQGGSTITQQVLKNNLLYDITDKWERKFMEIYIAPKFEEKYNKKQILEFYCNTNYYQNNCYGIYSASKFYFNKEPKDLTPDESAVLIGLSNNPTKYNPVKNPLICKNNRDNILKIMNEYGIITNEQYTEAVNKELVITMTKEIRSKEDNITSYAIHCAVIELMRSNNFNFKYIFDTKEEYTQYQEYYDNVYHKHADKIRMGGYKIYTTIDVNVQNDVRYILDSQLSNIDNSTDEYGRYNLQGSAVVIDNDTQCVVALAGGRSMGNGDIDEYNRAYQAYRQPGSSIKPLLYATSFDTGLFYPSKRIKNQKIKDKGAPKNWDGVYSECESIRKAVEHSINVVAYNVLSSIGVDTFLEKLNMLLFTGLSWQDDNNLSLAVGGFTYGVSPVEMAKAYSCIYNKGLYNSNNIINKLTYGFNGKQSEILFDLSDEKYKYTNLVFSEDSCELIVDCMKDVLTGSDATGRVYNINGIDLCGKTGTTNDNKDSWFVGMSPKYTIAVWEGYDIPTTLKDGGRSSGIIWRELQKYFYNNIEEYDLRKFKDYENISLHNISRNTGVYVDYKSGKKDYFSNRIIDMLQNPDLLNEYEKQLDNSSVEGKKYSQKMQDFIDWSPNVENSEEIDTFKELYNSISSDKIDEELKEDLDEHYYEFIENENSKIPEWLDTNNIKSNIDVNISDETNITENNNEILQVPDGVLQESNNSLQSELNTDTQLQQTQIQQSEQFNNSKVTINMINNKFSELDTIHPNNDLYISKLLEIYNLIQSCYNSEEYNNLINKYNRYYNMYELNNKIANNINE